MVTVEMKLFYVLSDYVYMAAFDLDSCIV
jgi:hypothetical protein